MQGEEGREKEDTKKEVGITTAITLKRQLGMRSGTPSGKIGLFWGSGWFTRHNCREVKSVN